MLYDYNASTDNDDDSDTGANGIADTDLIIYVSANDTSCGTNTLAWATSCDIDQYGRPIAGTINFCQNSLTGNRI